MPSLNFLKRFVPAVKAGLAFRAEGRHILSLCVGEVIKLQSIRRIGKRSYKAGDTLQLYYGQRTVACEKLGEAVCSSVQQIRINPSERAVSLEHSGCMRPLFDDEIEALAVADGFADADGFFEYFATEAAAAGCRAFVGQLIKW